MHWHRTQRNASGSARNRSPTLPGGACLKPSTPLAAAGRQSTMMRCNTHPSKPEPPDDAERKSARPERVPQGYDKASLARRHGHRRGPRACGGARPPAREPVTADPTQEVLNDVPATWYGAEQWHQGTILYLHGGAWCLHLPHLYRQRDAPVDADGHARAAAQLRLAPGIRFLRVSTTRSPPIAGSSSRVRRATAPRRRRFRRWKLTAVTLMRAAMRVCRCRIARRCCRRRRTWRCPAPRISTTSGSTRCSPRTQPTGPGALLPRRGSSSPVAVAAVRRLARSASAAVPRGLDRDAARRLDPCARSCTRCWSRRRDQGPA